MRAIYATVLFVGGWNAKVWSIKEENVAKLYDLGKENGSK